MVLTLVFEQLLHCRDPSFHAMAGLGPGLGPATYGFAIPIPEKRDDHDHASNSTVAIKSRSHSDR